MPPNLSLHDPGFVGSAGAGAGASCPADICTDLKAWWDFSDLSTIDKDGSDKISVVTDKSGNGFDLTQDAGASQPTWLSADRNGLDTADFGSAGFMKAQWSNLSQPHITGGACYMPPSSASNQDNVYDVYSSVGGDSGGGFANDDTNALTIYSPSNTPTSSSGFTATWAYFVNTYGTSGDLRMNGVSKTTGDTGTTAYNGMTVNRHRSGSTYGDTIFGELFVYTSALSSANITSLETYLSDKWGF